MAIRETLVDHRIGADGRIITNLNRSKQLGAWCDIAIVTDFRYGSPAAELRADIDASMNSAVRSNSGARIHHDGAVMKNREPRTENVDGNRKTQLDRKSTKAIGGETPTKRIFSAVREKFDFSQQTLEPKNLVVPLRPAGIHTERNTVGFQIHLVVCIRLDQAVLSRCFGLRRPFLHPSVDAIATSCKASKFDRHRKLPAEKKKPPDRVAFFRTGSGRSRP